MADFKSSPITARSESYAYILPERFRPTLSGRTVLVTGAGRGIGRHIALAFASVGCKMAFIARTESEILELADEIVRDYQVECLGLVADVTSSSDVDSVVMRVEAELGRVEVLVNNAAIDWISPFESEPDLDRWWRVMETNLRGPLLLTRSVLPGMLRAGRGVIISIGSRNAVSNIPFMTAYSCSKTALLRFHQCLQLEIQGRGICTYVLQPGDMATTLSSANTAVNLDAAACSEDVRDMLRLLEEKPVDSFSLPAHTCVALAAGGQVEVLSGLYVDAQEDLEQVIARMNARPSGARQLYTLGLEHL